MATVETPTNEISRIADENFSDDLWEPMSTGREPLDRLMSSDGTGIMPGTCMLVIGDPGVGKSTVTMEMLSNMMQQGRDVLFVSAEMSKIDVASMARRFPVYEQLPIWYPDFRTEKPLQKFEAIVNEGYDFIVIDSLAQFKEIVSIQTSFTQNETLVRFFTAVQNAMEGVETEDGIQHTSFGIIQQVTKDGKMAGKRFIEHTVTSVLEIRHASGDERYIEFGKNRRGGNQAKLFFRIGEDDIDFDGERLDMDMEAQEWGERERKRNREEQKKMESIEDAVEEDDFDDVESLINDTGSVTSAGDDYRFERPNALEIGSISDDELDAVVDADVIADYYEGTDGTIKRSRDQAIEDGHWPGNASRYYFEKFLARHDIADWDEESVS